MIEVRLSARPGVQAQIVEIDEKGISFFHYDDYQRDVEGTKIAWNGNNLFTLETAEKLASRLLNKLHLIILTIPATASPRRPKFAIWLNVKSIGGIRAAGTGTAIFLGRAWFAVEESIDTIRAAIDRSSAQPTMSTMSVALDANTESQSEEMSFQDAPLGSESKAGRGRKKVKKAPSQKSRGVSKKKAKTSKAKSAKKHPGKRSTKSNR
jgi:hypothetical protein